MLSSGLAGRSTLVISPFPNPEGIPQHLWDNAAAQAMRTYYVYIMTNRTRTLYTGVANNLERRALQREKQIKGWLRVKKVALVVATNPTWRDLSEDWYGKEESGDPLRSPAAAK
jgi:putative endonuclease